MIQDMKVRKPTIISASRRTDIPAFYMEDFLKSWKKGFFEWVNPFNSHQRSIVSTENVEVVVFWSKFPVGLLKRLNELDFKFYLLYTLNDYPELELNLPPFERRIELFKEISDILGKNRIVWRFDPIVLTEDIGPEDIVKRFEKIARNVSPFTFRVIVSFMTPYRKAIKRMERCGHVYREPSIDEMCHVASSLSEISKEFNLEIQTCSDRFNSRGELEMFGLKKGACIDRDYIERTFNIELGLKKDRGQRKECLCIESVDVGLYGTCKFNCLYCYAL